MPRKVVPPKVSAVMAASDPLLKVKRAKLRQALGLEPAEGEDSILSTFPRPRTFTREEVIALLGDGEKGIPRMLPVDIALGRLGMPIVRAHPDGTAERLTKDFPEAWAARIRSDRAIATYVAKTYAEVPKGWYPDAERLQMSDAEAEGAGLAALGPAERQESMISRPPTAAASPRDTRTRTTTWALQPQSPLLHNPGLHPWAPFLATHPRARAQRVGISRLLCLTPQALSPSTPSTQTPPPRVWG